MMETKKVAELAGCSLEHAEHLKGAYFQKGCDDCAIFIGKYQMSGRSWRP